MKQDKTISKEIKVKQEEAGKRIDVFTSEKTGISRSQIQKLIDKGYLLVNEKPRPRNYRLKANDVINLIIDEKTGDELIPEPLPVEIHYQDKNLIVVDKPPGMVVYPAAGHNSGTLTNAIKYHSKSLATIGGPLRPGIVHRLDKDTSGTMVVALDNKAYYNLIEQFKNRTIKRRYLALIFGNIKENSGEISAKIGRSESDRKKMSTRVRRGKEAITSWRVIERFQNATLIEARLRTGRTHQIRVHFASIGHPVLGDRIYGKKIALNTKSRRKILFPRQMLHAELLGFVHPISGEYLEFLSPMPEDMREKIRELKESL